MVQKTADCLHDFGTFEIEVKLQLQGLNLKARVFGREFLKLDIVAPAGEKFLI